MGGWNLTNHLPENFGSVKFSQNSNAKLHGANNIGLITQNANLQLTSSSSALDLKDNSNAKVKVDNFTIHLIHCFNSNIFGSGGKATLKDNSNLKYNSENAEVEAIDNTNLDVKSKGGVVKLLKNTNANVDTVQGSVTAEQNVNFKISGQGGKAIVKGTENHELKKNDRMNKVELSLSSKNSGWSGSWLSNTLSVWGGNDFKDLKNVKFTVDYVDQAVIEGGNYKLGVFDFTINRRSLGNYEVKLNESNMDGGRVDTESKGQGEIIIKGRKQGVVQELKLCGPKVSQKDKSENAFLIDLTGYSN